MRETVSCAPATRGRKHARKILDRRLHAEPSFPNYVLAICFLLTAMNVMDRQLLASAAGAIQTEFLLSDTQLGLLTGFALGIGKTSPVSRTTDIRH